MTITGFVKKQATLPQNLSPQQGAESVSKDACDVPASFENSDYLTMLADDCLKRSATLPDDRYSRKFGRFLQERAASLLHAAINPTLRVKNNYVFDSAVYEACPELAEVMDGECSQAEEPLYSPNFSLISYIF